MWVFFREYIGFRLSTIMLGFVFVLPYAFFTCQQSSLLPVYLYCIYKSIEVMVDVFHGIDQKAGNMIYCGMSMLLRGILSLLVFCAGMYISHSLVLSIVLMIAVSLPWWLLMHVGLLILTRSFLLSGSRRCLNCFISVFPLRLGFLLRCGYIRFASRTCYRTGSLNAGRLFLGVFSRGNRSGGCC